MGTQIQETTRSARAELSSGVRTVSVAEDTAPSASEGVDVQDWDQVAIVFGGDANGSIDVQAWLRYAKYDKGSGRADIWVPQDEKTGVPVVGYTAGSTSAGEIVVNTYGADRLHCLVTGLTGPSNAYIKYYGLTPKGGASQPLPGGSAAVSVLSGAKIQLTDWTNDSVLSSTGGVGVAGLDDSGEPTFRTLRVDTSGRQRVVGAAAEDAAVAGYPVLAGGRYDAADRTLDDGDVGALAVTAAGHLIVSVGGGSGTSLAVAGSVAHDSAVSTQYPVVTGSVASAADPTAVSADQDVVRDSADLYGYKRTRSKAYDAVANADRVSPTVDPSDRYEEGELVDTTNVAAGTNYYPSSAGLVMEGYDGVCIQGVISGGVVETVEATIDDASSPDWVDITMAGLDLITGVALNASFTDTNSMLDYSGLKVKAIRVKAVTSDATNGVQFHFKRTRTGA